MNAKDRIVFWGAIVLVIVCGELLFYMYREQMINKWSLVVLQIVQTVFFGYFVFKKRPRNPKDVNKTIE